MLATKRDFALELKRLLVAAERHGRLKRATLARTIGVSPSSLYAYLDGTTLPPPDVLDRLLHALGVPAAHRRQLVAVRDIFDPRQDPERPGEARPVPFELPPDVSGFTGRDAELATLDALLTRTRRSTVMITAVDGTAGVGKTALAVHFAHRVRHRFPDGQLYLNMGGYGSSQPLPPLEALVRLLHTLGLPAERVPAEVDAAASAYRSLLADRQVLLVLDNAADAEQVRPLLPAGAGSAVVVTSRNQLGGLVARDGAHRLHLSTLAPRDALALLTRILEAAPRETELHAVTELAELCGHLPLALRIAAANLITRPHQRVTEYVARRRAENRIGALTVAGDAHSAVSVSFDLSYQRLATPARRVFRLLGLVPGPDVTAAAAAALAGLDTPEAARVLDELACAHLIEEHAVGRYTCHDLLRHYAADLASREETPQDREAAWTRLLSFYLATADAAAQILYPSQARLPADTLRGHTAGFAGHDQALAWLDDESPCLVAAVKHAGRRGPEAMACLLADALRGYFWLRRNVSDWLVVGEAALAAARACGDTDAQAAAFLTIGDANHVRGRHEQALAGYRQVQLLCAGREESDIQFAAVNNTGGLYLRSGRLREAAECYQEVLDFDRRVGFRLGEAMRLANLGAVYRAMGQLERAADAYEEGMIVPRRDGNQKIAALQIRELGEIRHVLGDFDSAEALLTEALSLHRGIGDRAGEAEAQLCLAAIHRDRDRPAIDLAGAALVLAQQVGDSNIEANALNCLATIHNRYGRHREALEHHEQALQTAADAHLRHPQAEALVGLAATHRHLRDHREALDRLRQAIAIVEDAGFRLLHAQALTVLTRVHLADDDTGRAVEVGRRALGMHHEIGHRLGEARTHLLLGHAYQHAGDTAGAHEHRTSAHAVFTDIGISGATDLTMLFG
jgi:tetratricopeptide (TPR) repeat protein